MTLYNMNCHRQRTSKEIQPIITKNTRTTHKNQA